MAQRFRLFYQRIADQKQIQCRSAAPADVPSVWTDRVATATALDNVFSNAVKYSPPGKRNWVEVVPQQDWVICRVRDEGPGRSQEDQAKLFQPGALLTPRPTAGELSTGYGLAVAKDLIEKIGGRSGARAWWDRGPVFLFDSLNIRNWCMDPGGRYQVHERARSMRVEPYATSDLRVIQSTQCSWPFPVAPADERFVLGKSQPCHPSLQCP